MQISRKQIIWLSGLALLACIGAVGGGMIIHARPPSLGLVEIEEPEGATDSEVLTVQTIRPKHDSSFRVSVQQLARVEAYYHANLRARVAGVVKRVTKDIGAPVRRGEVLAEIDVPELDREVEQKEAVIAQRKQELVLAEAQVKNARAVLDVVTASIRQREAEATQAQAVRDYRRKRLVRYRHLASRDAITGDIVDEQERDSLAAEAAYEGAQAAVKKAKADYAEKESSLEAALADVKLKESLIEVARKDRDRALALAEYTRLVAPFDGLITRRNVDPGAFVQNSASATTEPLLSVARVDLVTVSIRLPDNAAPFVGDDTEADILIDDLPGVTIRGQVTRFAPAIDESDRTMRVEVDLFNGSEEEFRRLHGRAAAAVLAPLGQLEALGGLTLGGAGQSDVARDMKNYQDGLPLRAVTTAGASLDHRLLPGMTGYMRLYLDKFTNAYLLPSSAVFSKGGKPYLLVAKDGVTCLLPVKVQVNDGKLVKVVALSRNPSHPSEHEVIQELTGEEAVIPSRQLEIGEGQAVRAVPTDW